MYLRRQVAVSSQSDGTLRGFGTLLVRIDTRYLNDSKTVPCMSQEAGKAIFALAVVSVVVVGFLTALASGNVSQTIEAVEPILYIGFFISAIVIIGGAVVGR